MEELYHLNDNELMYMMRTGDVVAEQLLMKKYESYLCFLIDRYVDQDLIESKEDLIQECRILLLELCNTYRVDQQARFITYLVNSVRNLIHAKMRHEKRKHQHVQLISLDTIVRDGADESLIEFLDTRIAYYQPEYEWRYADTVARLKQVVEELSDRDKQVWFAMNANLSNEEAAKQLHYTPKQYENRKMRLKKRIICCIMGHKTYEYKI